MSVLQRTNDAPDPVRIPERRHYRTSVINASESPWNDVEILGRTLGRAEALAHPLIQEVFHITDHMVVEDAPLKAYLDAPAS